MIAVGKSMTPSVASVRDHGFHCMVTSIYHEKAVTFEVRSQIQLVFLPEMKMICKVDS